MNEASTLALPVRVAGGIAGFVVEDEARLRFVAADRRFGVLDGSRFWHLHDAERAADRLARTTSGEPRAASQPRLTGRHGSA